MRFESKQPEDPQRRVVRMMLEQAGATLMAMPGVQGGGRLGSAMPEPVHEFIEAFGRDPIRARVPRPTSEQITRMDQTLAWISLIPAEPGDAGSGLLHRPGGGVLLRRIVSARCLVFPNGHARYGEHVYSWQKLAEFMGANRNALPGWHSMALGVIVDQLLARKKLAQTAAAA